MKRHHVLGFLLDAKTGRAYMGSSLNTPLVVSRCADGAPLELDESLQPPRDWRVVIAATCFAVLAVAAMVIGIVALATGK